MTEKLSKNSEPRNIRLTLIQKNNVIVAECDGLRTEMFMPVIDGENINIINLNCLRRCPCVQTSHIVAKTKSSNWRLSNLSFSRQTNELTNQPFQSTPKNLKSKINEKETFAHAMESFHMNQSVAECDDENLSSPEQIRNIPHVNTNNIQHFRNLSKQNVNTMTLNDENPKRLINHNTLITGLNVDNNHELLQFNNINSASNNSYKIPINVVNTSENISIIEWPYSPSNEAANKSIGTHLSESNNSYEIPVNVVNTSENISIIDWPYSPSNEAANKSVGSHLSESTKSKVLRPTRTYSRFQHLPNDSTSPLAKKKSNIYFRKSTQGVKPSKTVVLKKMYKRPKIDEKINISTKSFKKQFEYEKAVKQTHSIQREYKDCKILQKSAFDLLTTPLSKQRCFSPKLQQQFRERCLNKGSSTYPKYKKLACLSTEISANAAHPFLKDSEIQLPLPSSNISEYTIISITDSLDK